MRVAIYPQFKGLSKSKRRYKSKNFKNNQIIWRGNLRVEEKVNAEHVGMDPTLCGMRSSCRPGLQTKIRIQLIKPFYTDTQFTFPLPG